MIYTNFTEIMIKSLALYLLNATCIPSHFSFSLLTKAKLLLSETKLLAATKVILVIKHNFENIHF